MRNTMDSKQKYKVALYSECYGKPGYGGPVARHYNIAKVLKDNNIKFKVFGFNPRQVHDDYKLEEAVGGFPKNLDEYNIHWVEQGFQSIYTLNKNNIYPILGCNLLPNSGSEHTLPYLDEDGKNRQDSSIISEKKFMSTLKGKFWCSQSYFQEKEYYRLGLPLHSPVYRIYNPVDTFKFKPDETLVKKDFTVIWVGKPNWAKAPWILKKIAEKLPHITFLYVSNEPCKTFFTPNVTIIEKNENQDMPELYQSTHLYISTAVTENQPLAGLEAMACGLPTIAFRTSGFPEILKDNFNGVLVDLANIEHMCIEIEKMRLDDLRRINYGLNGRKYIEDNFSFKACFNQYKDLFDKYLQETKGIK